MLQQHVNEYAKNSNYIDISSDSDIHIPDSILYYMDKLKIYSIKCYDSRYNERTIQFFIHIKIFTEEYYFYEKNAEIEDFEFCSKRIWKLNNNWGFYSRAGI